MNHTADPGAPWRAGNGWLQAAWLVAAVSTLLIPLWVSISASGSDQFKLGKTALLRAEGLLIGALLITAIIHGGRDVLGRWNLRHRPILILPLLMSVWAIVTALASDLPAYSTASVVTVFAAAAIFYICYDRGRRSAAAVYWVLLIPALINAAAAMLETSPAWDQRFTSALMGGDLSPEMLRHASPIGFMGNRGYLAGLLLVAAVLALAASFSTVATVWTRVAAVLLIGGLVAAKTITALAALVVAVVLIAFLRSTRTGIATALLLAISLPAAFLLHPGLRHRARRLHQHWKNAQYEEMVTGRVAPNAAAMAMVLEHPWSGVGPGQFARNYLHYRREAGQQFSELRSESQWWMDVPYHEAHNDHLQVAAEGGLAAYLLFAAALITGAGISLRRPAVSTPKTELARLAAAPLFAAIAISALAHFPLQLGGVLQVTVVAAGLVCGWSDDAPA